MSLFDIIRYPVNDIFSDEIDSYPREIMIPWLKNCYKVADIRESTNVDECRSFSTFIKILIIRYDMNLSDDGKVEAGDTLKAYFTFDLQRRIRDH